VAENEKLAIHAFVVTESPYKNESSRQRIKRLKRLKESERRAKES